MADEKIVTSIVATSDFSGLIADVQRTTAALSKLQQELSLSNKTLAVQAGQIQKAFGETLRSTGQFTTHFVTVGSEVENFGKKLDGGKLKLGEYFRTWQQHTKTSGGLIRDLAKQQVALQQAIVQPLGKAADGMMKFNVHVANGLDTTVNKTALARKELQIYNKVIQDGGVQLINWGKNTQWAGRQLTVGLTVPLAAFGAAAAKAFREADQELVRLQKVYGGLSAVSAQELEKVRRDVSATAKELAGMYGASYKETIGLAADIAATGKQGNELLQSTREATRLSILGEVDRQESMKATLAIQSAFKQNTQELTESINFLNAVENQTSTSLGDLVEAIPKAGPVVKALGGDVQDLALYLTAMREGGINASEGANALKSALASIINPTKVAKEQFMSFGIDLSGIVNKNAGNLTATILGIQAALETLDPLKKSQAIEQLFGKFQFARMNALFENLGKQGSQTLQVLDLMKASSQDLANVAGRELSQITESASGQYKRAIESLKADLAGLGDQFLKIGTFFIKVVDGVIKFVNQMPDPIKNLLGLLGGITALAGPLIMLTGVFANFIGYVIKGIGHLRALGRGGEGFKLLTPQILAAEQAGSLIEKTFYSDAQAANILSVALANLAKEYEILQVKAAAGSVSAQPIISTIAGNVVMEGSERVADPDSKYIGKPYSRQMSHTRPVAGMTNQEKSAQNIFGVVPGPGPVNQKVSKNPQIYMTNDLPRISGLTEISGVSTGIVAQEAAKWHSMTAALAMQSQEEIVLLKSEVAATGAITSQLSESYGALLPQMTNITTLAAQESSMIVADLQASKITVDQARAKVIELNARIEVMMSETAAAVAASQGRVANLNVVPLTGQPVADPVTGKSNMKEMFHKSNTSKLVDKIARSLGVRTSGGGYSIETTKPRRFARGGDVEEFGPNKTTVSGPASINYDDRMGSVPLGGYVLNQRASLDPSNKDLIAMAPTTYNQGGNTMNALLTPKETVFGPGIHDNPELYAAVEAANNGFSLGGRIKASKINYGLFNPRVIATAANIRRMFPANLTSKHAKPSYEVKGTQGAFGGGINNRTIVEDNRVGMEIPGQTITRSRINRLLEKEGVPPDVLLASIYSGSGSKRLSTDVLLEGLVKSGVITSREATILSDQVFETYAKKLATLDKVTDMNNPILESSREALSVTSSIDTSRKSKVLEALNRFAASPGSVSDVSSRGSSGYLQYITLSDGTKINLSSLKGGRGAAETFFHAPMPEELKRIVDSFAMGGLIGQNKKYYGLKRLPKNVIERLTARWPKKKDFWPQGHQYILGNTDPLHGPLQIGKSQNLKSYAGYDPNANPAERILYRDNFDRVTTSAGFLVGDERRRGLYSTARYMSGDLDIMSQMERLKNHPLGPIAAMKGLQTKFSGRLYRGILGQSTQNPLPKHILDKVLLAKQNGDWSDLLGKEFIMRRSSWSKDQEVASFFAMRNQRPDSILLEAAVKNRNILDASSLFPGKAYQAPYGQSYNTGRFGTGAKNEQEAIFGGKFKIVGYKNGAVQLETVAEAREMGGDVTSGKPYLVGEKGPELFVPRNSGGIIPNYALGGNIMRGKMNYGYRDLRKTVRGQGTLRAPKLDENGQPIVDMNSGMASSMAGMAMMMGGSQMPGMAGQAMTFAGMGMQMAPILKMMTPMIKGMGTFAGILAKVKIAATAGLTALRIGLAALMGPVGLASIAIGGIVTAILKIKDNATKAGEVNRSMFGLTSSALEEVGIKYKTMSERIKDVNAQLELNRARVKASYQEYTKSGVAGLDLTLKQLKDGIASAKKEDKESVGLFNNAKSSQVNQLASSMKAQYMALGMSVQEATNQIYILIKASNKSSQAVSAISSEEFKKISDRASAATYSVEMLGKVLSDKGLFNAEEFARGLDSMLNSLDAYKSSLMETTKTQMGVSEAEALKNTMEKIKKVGGDKAKLDDDTLTALKAQNYELGLILGKSETLASVFAKSQLFMSGAANDINVSSLSAEEAVLALEGYNATKEAASKVLGETKLSINAAEAEKQAKEASKILKNAQKADNSYIDTAIKNKQKLIKQLEEERNARLKILDLQEKSAGFETNIKQAQIRYQEALAAGDMAQAAQEQLNIQQLSGDRQRELARQSINDKADKERKKLEDQIEKLQAEKDAKEKAIINAQKTSAKKEENAGELKGFLAEIKDAVAGFGGNTKDDRTELMELLARMRKSGRGSEVNDLFTSFGVNQNSRNPYGQLLAQLKSQTDTELAKPEYDKFDTAVETFKKAVDVFVGMTNPQASKGKSGSEFGPDKVKSVSGETVGDAARQAVAGKQQSRKFEDYQGRWTQFKYRGKTYVVSEDETTIYEYDEKTKQKVGERLKSNYVPAKMAQGGLIKGPGTGTSDSIAAMVMPPAPGFAGGGMPIRVSDGEYIFSKKAIDNLGGASVVDKMHKSARSKDGWLQKWAKSISGQAGSEMMGTAPLLRLLAGIGGKGDKLGAAMAPLSFAGMGIGSKIGSSGGLMKSLFAVPNKINQIRNQAKVNAMIKRGMWHGSQPQGHRGEEYLQGTNILDGPESHDPYYGMGFFGTSSKGEADLYASGYNSSSNWGASFGSMNNIVGAPKGKYVDFTRGTNSLKWQDYSLAKALGVKRNGYIGNYMPENLGDIMSGEGMTGAIMNRVNAGHVPKDIAGAKWLAWNNPAGVITKEKFAMGGMPKYEMGGMPRYNIPSDSLTVANKPFNSYASGGSAVYNNNFTINPAEGMDTKMFAKYAIEEMKKSNYKNFSEQGSPGARLI
jgi:TP901 family phage tail tape measure protein